MVIKKFPAFVFIFLISLLPLNSQDTNLYYSFTENKDTISFTQTLEWEKVSYAKSYEVVLERKNDVQEWTEYNTYATETNILEISLNPGTYRYNISIWNPLKRKESPSEWYEFTILQALKPEIKSFEPQNWYIADKEKGFLQVTGNNILTDSKITLEKKDDNFSIPVTMNTTKEGAIIFEFDETLLTKGNYVFQITNPGGLFDSSSQFNVLKKRPTLLFLSSSLAPIMALQGGKIQPYFDNKLHLKGMNATIGTLPFILSYGEFGAKIKLAAYLMILDIKNYNAKMSLVPATFYLTYQLPLIDNKSFLDFSLGAGVTYMNIAIAEIHNNGNTKAFLALAINASLGISYQHNLFAGLFLKVGTETDIHLLMDSTYLHTISPTIGLVYKF